MDLRDALMNKSFMKIQRKNSGFRIYDIKSDDNGYLTEDSLLLCKELKISEEDAERMLKVPGNGTSEQGQGLREVR